ncbi:MAG: hypothetical protein R3F14_25320 [Polyangiaceae bacterium]
MAMTPVATPGSLRFGVLHATYGTARNGFDVTPICQWLLDNGGDTITVSNETFGGDPEHGVQKRFGILYTHVGSETPRSLATAEGVTLKLR